MRRRRAARRKVLVDPKFRSDLVARMINMIMERGKKSLAEQIVYRAFDVIGERTGKDPLEVYRKALDHVRPLLETRSRRVGGATYQVPMEVRSERGNALAMRWIKTFSRKKKGRPMHLKLADELLDAYNGQGASVKKREEVHKMAESNRAFAHYRW